MADAAQQAGAQSPTVFFGSYTAHVKQYCDERFLRELVAPLLGEPQVVGSLLLDNGDDAGQVYFHRLCGLRRQLNSGLQLAHLQVAREPRASLLHRRITLSANVLRARLLHSRADYLL